MSIAEIQQATDRLIGWFEGAPRRSPRRIAQAVAWVGKDRRRVRLLMGLLSHQDRVVRMHAAEALERATRSNDFRLPGFTLDLLQRLATFEENEWEAKMSLIHVLARQRLRRQRLNSTVDFLLRWLTTTDKPAIKVRCMEWLTRFTLQEAWYHKEVATLIKRETMRGSAMVRTRGRALLRQLAKQSPII
jgi:hypothetical protein